MRRIELLEMPAVIVRMIDEFSLIARRFHRIHFRQQLRMDGSLLFDVIDPCYLHNYAFMIRRLRFFLIITSPSLNRVPFLHQFPSDRSIPWESLFQTEFQFIQVFIDRLHGILEFRTKKLGSIVGRGWRKLAIVKILFRREGEDLTLR